MSTAILVIAIVIQIYLLNHYVSRLLPLTHHLSLRLRQVLIHNSVLKIELLGNIRAAMLLVSFECGDKSVMEESVGRFSIGVGLGREQTRDYDLSLSTAASDLFGKMLELDCILLVR